MVVRLVWNWVDRVSPRTFARLEFGRCNMGLRSDIRGPWKEIFFGGRVLEVRIFMEVGVAFRKKYSVTVNNIGGGRVSHMFGARGMLVILLCGKVPYVV